MRSDSEQTGHREEPMAGGGWQPGLQHTAQPGAVVRFSGIFRKRRLAFVNMLPGWEDAHALRKL